MKLCKIDRDMIGRKLDMIMINLTSNFGPDATSDANTSEIENRIKQFRKCVDCPDDNDEFFCMCDCVEQQGHEVAFAAVNTSHGPEVYVFVHSIVTVKMGREYGVELIKMIQDYYKKPLWMQCRPLGSGTIEDPYMVNNELLSKFYRRSCGSILNEFRIDNSVWDCPAHFFHTKDLTSDKAETLYAYLQNTYGISNPSPLDERVNKLVGNENEVKELKTIISEFVGKTISDELKDEMAERIIATAIKFHKENA